MDSEVLSYTTNDMGFAAYLIAIHSFKLVGAAKIGRTFKFDLNRIHNGNGVSSMESIKLQYVSSDCVKFDNAIRDIKRVLFSDRVQNGADGR
jgi:hypothetical protein